MKIKFVAPKENLEKTLDFKNPTIAQYVKKKVIQMLENAGLKGQCPETVSALEIHEQNMQYRYAIESPWEGTYAGTADQTQHLNSAIAIAEEFKPETDELTMLYAVKEGDATFVRAFNDPDPKNVTAIDALLRAWMGVNGVKCDSSDALCIEENGKLRRLSPQEFDAKMQDPDFGFQKFCQTLGVYKEVKAVRESFPAAAEQAQPETKPVQPVEKATPEVVVEPEPARPTGGHM